MWINRKTHDALVEKYEQELSGLRAEAGSRRAEHDRLHIENTRLRADMDWFKHRLTQSEHERGMLMMDRLGVKISTPKFVDDSEGVALHQMPELGHIGGDAAPDHESNADMGLGVDYSLLPGYTGKR